MFRASHSDLSHKIAVTANQTYIYIYIQGVSEIEDKIEWRINKPILKNGNILKTPSFSTNSLLMVSS